MDGFVPPFHGGHGALPVSDVCREQDESVFAREQRGDFFEVPLVKPDSVPALNEVVSVDQAPALRNEKLIDVPALTQRTVVGEAATEIGEGGPDDRSIEERIPGADYVKKTVGSTQPGPSDSGCEEPKTKRIAALFLVRNACGGCRVRSQISCPNICA